LPEKPAHLITRDFGLRAIVATEIEFYLHGAARELSQPDVIYLIEAECASARIHLACAEAERGPDQFEVSLLPAGDLSRIAVETERFKALMAELFAPRGIRADFAAKPLANAPGSGLHVHVHLEDEQGRNVFFREGEEFSPRLLQAIGGLLALMNPCMPVFAPSEESYRRLTAGPNPYLVCPTATNVPMTVSWGTNNRTVAVRLPSKPADNKHIEHRVAGSDTNTAQVIGAVLAGIHYGLEAQSDPGPPVYGDASLPQYGLPRLAESLEQARRYRQECGALARYMPD
jgi:glutamine synthetase